VKNSENLDELFDWNVNGNNHFTESRDFETKVLREKPTKEKKQLELLEKN